MRSQQRTTDNDEAELVRRAQQDPRHFAPIYEAYVERVFRFLALRTSSREVAEDLTSQTFLRALEHLAGYRPEAPFSAWVFRIARNLLIDHYRVSGRTVPLDPELDLADDSDIAGDVERTLEREALARALQQLSDDERELVELRVGANLSHAEIGAATGRSEAATKMAYMRTVQRLRTLLSPPT